MPPAETGPCTVATNLDGRNLSRELARELTSAAAAAQRKETAETSLALAYEEILGTQSMTHGWAVIAGHEAPAAGSSRLGVVEFLVAALEEGQDRVRIGQLTQWARRAERLVPERTAARSMRADIGVRLGDVLIAR